MELGDTKDPPWVSLVREFIGETIAEGRVREADVSDGSKVQFGDWRHILDLEKRVRDLVAWRDRSPRGSEVRANYARLVNRLNGELRSARSHREKMGKKRR